MSTRIEPNGHLIPGFRSGIYEWKVGNVHKLGDEIIESLCFEMEGFDWQLKLFRGSGNRSNKIRIFLCSCNDEAVYADVKFLIRTQGKVMQQDEERESRTAGPFQCLDKRDIPVDKLTNVAVKSEEAEFIIEFNLKNIQAATRAQQRPLRSSMRTIYLEVIDHHSITRALNRRGSSGIVLRYRKRNSDVRGGMLVSLWARKNPDCRYWLCKRSGNGQIQVERCLNDAGFLESFDEICEQIDGGRPWVTVFREDKSRHDFQPIDDDTIMLFFLIFDSSRQDFSLLGHRLVQKTMTCRDLSTEISEMSQIPEGKGYEVCVSDEGTTCHMDISRRDCSLEECGVLSGSTVFLKMVESASGSQPESEIAFAHGSVQGSDQKGKGSRSQQTITSNVRMPSDVDVHSQKEEETSDRPKRTVMKANPNKELISLLLVCLLAAVLVFVSSHPTYFGAEAGGNKQASDPKTLYCSGSNS